MALGAGCNCDGGCRSDPDPENRCSPPLTLYFPYDPDKYLYELTKWGPTSSNKPRACGVARPGRRWPGKPDAGTKKIKTFKGCCDLCKRLPRCKRFQLGPKGCALFASKSSGPPKPAKGYIAGNGEERSSARAAARLLFGGWWHGLHGQVA